MDVLGWMLNAAGVFLLLFILLSTVVYFYSTAFFGYWEKQGVSGPKPWPVYGNINFQRPLHEIDTENYKKYGRFYGVYDGRMPEIIVADPELIRQVTIKDFWSFPHSREFPATSDDKVFRYFLTNLRGEQWKQVRNVMTPSFTTGKLKQMTYLIEECCKTLVKSLEKYAETQEPIEIKKRMNCFTIDVIASCAFGTKIDSMSDPENKIVKQAALIFDVSQVPKWAFLIILLHPKVLTWLPTKLLGNNPVNFLYDLIGKVLQMKRSEKQPRRDFLDLLLEAKAEDNNEESSNESSKKVLTEDVIIAQSVLFLLAGFESTATTLGFALYILAIHPEIQDKLVAEVDEVMDKYEDKLNYEALSKMTYLEMVISETLRMYPFATRVERTCVQDDFELNGIELKKGMLVGIPVYAIHHDPEFYPDPETFDPERFNAENKALRDPVTYLPFGSGPRNCIGMRFALMEAKMSIATIVRNFKIKRCPQTEVPLQFLGGFGLLQAKSLHIAIEKRK